MPASAPVSRLSLKNILFPTDLTSTARTALPFAQALARIYGSTLLFAHCLPPEPHSQVVTDRVPEQDDRIWLESRHKLNDLVQDTSLAEIPCKGLVDQGDLQDVIPEMIEKHVVDLVVLATHGRRGVSKLILGSGAEKIYLSAPCPVLTVGPKVAATSSWRLRRILCPVDLSEDPQPVLQYALSLAEENQAEFILLQAVPMVPWQHRASVEQQSWRALGSLIPEEAKNWCTPQCVVRWEHPAEAIVRESQERNVDLIVMSVHRSRAVAWSSHLPWPVASEVVSRAPCPVLTLRI